MPADSDKDYMSEDERSKKEKLRTKDLDKPEIPPYGTKALKSFDVAWDDLVKFGDCPVCMGEPRACPTPELPAARCPTRRAAIRNIKGGRSTARRPNY
jgi:hypothetical protein